MKTKLNTTHGLIYTTYGLHLMLTNETLLQSAVLGNLLTKSTNQKIMVTYSVVLWELCVYPRAVHCEGTDRSCHDGSWYRWRCSALSGHGPGKCTIDRQNEHLPCQIKSYPLCTPRMNEKSIYPSIHVSTSSVCLSLTYKSFWFI